MFRLCRRAVRSVRWEPVLARRLHVSRQTLADEARQHSKPKETTSLRKGASASLPLRAKATPTRGSIRPAFILTTAIPYNLHQLRKVLPQGSLLFQDAFWVPKWGPAGSEGEIFIFYANGSVVSWGLEEADTLKFATQFLVPKGEVGQRLLQSAETEDIEFVTDPNEPTRLQGDLIVLGSIPPLDPSLDIPDPPTGFTLPGTTFTARYAFSQALARSTSLSVLETALDKYLTSMAALPETLSSTGKPGLSRKQLIKRLGELLKFRQGLNLNRENFADIPDFYWAEPVLEGYFKSVSEALEIKSRTALVNEKITYAAEVQSVLRQLLTEKSSHRMELIIIALIAVEVVIAIIRDGPELLQMMRGIPAHEERTSGAHLSRQ